MTDTTTTPKAKKPFRRKHRVFIVNVRHDFAGRFATVAKCRGRLVRTYDRNTKKYSKDRRFFVELNIDGVEEPKELLATDCISADSINMDGIRDTVEKIVALGASHQSSMHKWNIDKLDEAIQKMRDDLALSLKLDLESEVVPTEVEVEDKATRICYGYGYPSEWSHSPITINARSYHYDARVDVNFSAFSATPAQLLAYARQLHAAAKAALALQYETLEKLEKTREEELKKHASVDEYVKNMKAQFDAI